MIVHCILDRFSYACFRREAELVPVPLHGAVEGKADLLFVETAWDSIGGRWSLEREEERERLRIIVRHYRRRGVPTVFWNKEDPPHYGLYDDLTPCFDFVLTTDEDCVEKHRMHVGHDRVGLMMFAARPDIHFCDPRFSRIARPCFAGSSYDAAYSERLAQQEYVLKPALRHGLVIFDRRHGDPALYAPRHGKAVPDRRRFPPEYEASVVGGLSYEALCNVYRQYRVFLNINSVTGSKTMFPRRVLELLASGTPLISGYARGIEEQLTDGVLITRTARETDASITMLLKNDDAWSRLSLGGQRAVLARHTVAHRWSELLAFCGLPAVQETEKRKRIFEHAALQTTQEELTAVLRQERGASAMAPGS